MNAHARCRGRAAGTAIAELVFKYHGNHTFVSHNHLPWGDYAIFVELRYLSFDPENQSMTPLQDQVIINEIMKIPMSAQPTRQNSSICPGSLNELHGYWATPAITGVAAPFSIGGHQQVAHIEDLEYELEHCSLLSYNVLDSCMHGTQPYATPLSLCIIGDSQARLRI